MSAPTAEPPYFGDESPPRNTTLKRINRCVNRLDFRHIDQVLSCTEGDMYLCDVSSADWDRYVLSERQLLKSRFMEWRAGKLYIIDLPSILHETLSRGLNHAIILATGTYDDHLMAYGSAYIQHLEHIEPDESFGPSSDDVLGVQVPAGLPPYEFHTLKVEVGVHERWASLDRKATRWSTFPGVQYILCMYVSPKKETREYKLHEVQGGAIVQPDMEATAITAPATLVSFNSHRLLGLPAGAPLPPCFASPNVTIDLHTVVTRSVRGLM